MRGVIPLENPVFTPLSAASLRRNGGLGRGGSFSSRPPCLLFPLFYIAWRCAQPLRATAQEGCWHFVCSISWTHRPFDEASNEAGAGNEWVSARRQKTRGQLHGNGSFSHRPPRSSSRGEHVACRRTVPSSCAGGGGKTRPRKRQMQGKNVICNDLCAKSACISKKKPTFAVELSYYYCQPHHAKKITSFLHGAAHLGGGAHGGRPPQAQ